MSVTHSIGVVTQLERWNDKFGRRYLRKDILVDEHGNIHDVQEPEMKKQKQSIITMGNNYFVERDDLTQMAEIIHTSIRGPEGIGAH